jgi:hypothetical protein
MTTKIELVSVSKNENSSPSTPKNKGFIRYKNKTYKVSFYKGEKLTNVKDWKKEAFKIVRFLESKEILPNIGEKIKTNHTKGTAKKISTRGMVSSINLDSSEIKSIRFDFEFKRIEPKKDGKEEKSFEIEKENNKKNLKKLKKKHGKKFKKYDFGKNFRVKKTKKEKLTSPKPIKKPVIEIIEKDESKKSNLQEEIKSIKIVEKNKFEMPNDPYAAKIVACFLNGEHSKKDINTTLNPAEKNSNKSNFSLGKDHFIFDNIKYILSPPIVKYTPTKNSSFKASQENFIKKIIKEKTKNLGVNDIVSVAGIITFRGYSYAIKIIKYINGKTTIYFGASYNSNNKIDVNINKFSNSNLQDFAIKKYTQFMEEKYSNINTDNSSTWKFYPFEKEKIKDFIEE